MDVFELRGKLVSDYADYTTSFIQIEDQRIRDYVANKLDQGLLWPEPLIQLNPSFEPGARIDDLVATKVLSAECGNIFRAKNDDDPIGKPLQLHKHQEDAIHVARNINEVYCTPINPPPGDSQAAHPYRESPCGA